MASGDDPMPSPWGSIYWPNGHFMVAMTLVEAGYATFAEWKGLSAVTRASLTTIPKVVHIA
jgi:hypothetical protein